MLLDLYINRVITGTWRFRKLTFVSEMTYRMLSGTFVQFYNDDGHFLQPATLTNVVVVYLLIMWCSYKSKSTFRFDFSY